MSGFSHLTSTTITTVRVEFRFQTTNFKTKKYFFLPEIHLDLTFYYHDPLRKYYQILGQTLSLRECERRTISDLSVELFIRVMLIK